MNYYIADMHLGHENVISLDGRPFETADEMDAALIANWNARVRPHDNVYILGDLCHKSKKSPPWYLKQLTGIKHLIVGNHDGHLLKDADAMSHFASVDKILFVKDGTERIILYHYPIAEWEGFHRGAWHIYGHIHNRKDSTYEYMKILPRALNAGCMLHGYTPITFKELVSTTQSLFGRV